MVQDPRQVEELFYAALALSPDERVALLARLRTSDPALAAEVESLFDVHERSGDWLDSPAYEAAAELILDSGPELPEGHVIAHYEIVAPLGRGGMGEVYLAKDRSLDRKVALKFLPARLTDNKERLRRFTLEARAASALNHPSIITIYEIGDIDGRQFIATEYIEGETLRHHVHLSRMKIRDLLDIAVQVASALSAAHQAGIIHRDIKPENLMLRPDGVVKVLDFGLAKLSIKQPPAADRAVAPAARKTTGCGMIMGTVHYMSPEQARGQEVDARSDIFSLGVVLYELVAGRTPFDGETSMDVLAAILDREPMPLAQFTPDVPADLQRIIMKCLRKRGDDRYQTMEGLLVALKELREELAVEAKLERSIRSASRDGGEGQQRSTGEAGLTRDQVPAAAGASRAPTGWGAVGKIKLHKGVVAAVLSILLLTAIGSGYWFYTHRSPSSGARQIDSIAVLPFENAGATGDTEYLSDGITESLINSLSQLPNVKVIARSSVFRYKGGDIDLAKIAGELNVQAVMYGRVSQRGDSLSISVDLMDARNNTQLWGRQFTRKPSDILAIQDEIARQVTDSLRWRLTGAQEERVAKRYTANEEAYKLYLQGRYFWNRRSVEDFKVAIPLFQKAIRIDPEFALAYSGLSDSYNLLGTYGGARLEVTMPQAKAAALKALSVDENLAEAHGSLGQYLLAYERDWTGGEREYRRAIELNPNYASAYQWYAELLYFSGRFEEAQVQARRAVELDPLSRIINSVYARAYLFARRYDEAITIFRKNIELNPDWYGDYEYLFYTYAAKGMFAAAVDAYVRFMTLARLAPAAEVQATQDSFARSGWEGFLRHRIKFLEEGADRQYFRLSELCAYLGEKDKAFAYLEKACQPGHCSLELKYKSAFDNLRADPRFDGFIRRDGFPQ